MKFESCSIYKAQCAEENISPLTFTELFQGTRDASVTRRVALQNSSVVVVVIAAQYIENT